MRIGIIGCGQLARMLAKAGWNMGLEFSFLANQGERTRCVRGLGRVVRLEAGKSPEQVYLAMGKPAIITVEREHVDIGLLRGLAAHCAVYPNPESVQACGHRLQEKALLDALGLATAPWRGAHTATQVADAVQALGLPVVVKAATAGYDGKQQWRLHSEAQLRALCSTWTPGDYLIERLVDFEREISIIAARSTSGELVFYPPTENYHRDGILVSSIAPASDLPADLLHDAYDYMARLLDALDYVGVLAMECFVTAEGLLVNELAPRVHNSGHWSLHSAETSQFENHLRALLGIRLGSTRVKGFGGIVNILGNYDKTRTLHALGEGAALVDYNKSAAPQRKLGHIHVHGDSREVLLREIERLRRHLDDREAEEAGPTTRSGASAVPRAAAPPPVPGARDSYRSVSA